MGFFGNWSPQGQQQLLQPPQGVQGWQQGQQNGGWAQQNGGGQGWGQQGRAGPFGGIMGLLGQNPGLQNAGPPGMHGGFFGGMMNRLQRHGGNPYQGGGR